MVECMLNGEHRITIPKHRAQRPDWYTDQGWERARLNAMRQRTSHCDTVYYVGAEEGEFPALCQMWGADIYLFEPNPKAWPNIRAVWEANNLTVPYCFPGFASNVTRQSFRQMVTKEWPPAAYGEIVGDHGFKELYLEADNYPQVRIDDVADAFSAPTIICFDVEGSEWHVLRGAERTLREHRPTLFASIHPEFMFHQWGQYSRDLRDWIIAIGYRETLLSYEHELHCLYEAV